MGHNKNISGNTSQSPEHHSKSNLSNNVIMCSPKFWIINIEDIWCQNFRDYEEIQI